tara:strand:- start:1501 stop:2124 length:624 start_codon:yes stop_codon:yes gene_type:complete
MKKEDLLKHIAETGYNVGFGAKKSFSTFDIVDKAPGIISFASMAFGIYALALDGLSTKFLSATFIIFGIIGLYISLYDNRKQEYEKAGVALTKLFNELGRLYRTTKNADESQIPALKESLEKLENQSFEISISKQILFSDWYAHYKFFWQHQIDWMEEQKQFKFWRDKIPLTLTLTIILLIILLVYFIASLSFTDLASCLSGVLLNA